MAKNFMAVRDFISQRFPELAGKIHGSNYPPPFYASWISSFVGFLQMFGLSCVFLGDSVWTYVPFITNGGQPPAFYNDLKQNPTFAFILVFIALPSVAQSFTATGAFEIILDDKTVIHSKLQTGKMPNGDDVTLALINAGMKFVSPGTETS